MSEGFHCARIKFDDVEDFDKLKSIKGFSRCVRYSHLRISIDDNGEVHACTDRAHESRADSKGHSGLIDTIGTDAIIRISKKFVLVKTSSTDTEAVSNGESFLNCTLFRYFRLA